MSLYYCPLRIFIILVIVTSTYTGISNKLTKRQQHRSDFNNEFRQSLKNPYVKNARDTNFRDTVSNRNKETMPGNNDGKRTNRYNFFHKLFLSLLTTNTVKKHSSDVDVTIKYAKSREKSTDITQSTTTDVSIVRKKRSRNRTDPNKISRVQREAIDCYEERLCKNNVNHDIPVCYCDQKCRIYNDCCIDYRLTEVPMDIDKIRADLKLKYTSCVRGIISDEHTWDRGYMLVTQCPEKENGTKLKANCEKERLKDLPVTSRYGLTYKNHHCARCHGVRNYLPWNLRYAFFCDVTLYDLFNISYSNELIDLFEGKDCNFDVFPSKETPRPRVCWDERFDFENLSISLPSAECEQYRNPKFRLNQIAYERLLDQKIDCRWEDKPCAAPVNDFTKFSVHRMSALFNLNVPTKIDDVKEGKFGFEAAVGNCELEIYFTVLTNASFVDHLTFRLMGLTYGIVQMVIPWEMKVTSTRALNIHCHIIQPHRNDTFPCLGSENCLKINIILYITLKEQVTLQEISDLHRSFNSINWTYIEKDTETLEYSFCTISFVSEKDRTSNNLPTALCPYYENQRIKLFMGMLHEHLKVLKYTNHGYYIPERLNVVASIEKNESNINSEIESFKILQFLFNSQETNQIKQTFSKRTENTYLKNIQNISTFVTMGLSSIFLLVTFVIHKYLNLSVNTAGKVSEHLMISMFFSHVLFMFGFGANDYHVICFVIGVISHYVWLSCFSWMSTYTITLLRAMLKLKQNPNSHMTNHFSNYNYITGYGFPLLIVLPSCVLDLCSNYRVGYSDDVCFPSVWPLNLVVFIAPISVSMVMNVVALIIAGRIIYIYQRSIEDCSKSIESRSYWPVYLRFFIFSGFSWSLGIIAEATNQDILRILFIYAAGCHGFLFSISLLISRQIQRKLRACKSNRSEDIVSSNSFYIQHLERPRTMET